MAFTVTSVAQAREMVERARASMDKLKEKAEGAIGTSIQIGEVTGTALGLGYVNGRFGKNGEVAIGGMPLDLSVAIAFHGMSFLGGFGKYAEHGHNIGTGALAACAYRTGARIGASAAAEAHASHQLPGATPPWALSQPQPQPAPATAQPGVPHFVPPTYGGG